MASDNAKAVDELKAAQQQMKTNLIAEVSEQNLRPKPSAPPSRPVASPTRRPVPTHPAWAADQLPAFEIVRNCSAEETGTGIGNDVASCTKDETDAKIELAKRWSRFAASNKKACVGESSTGGAQSYVELLTCLEMSTDQFAASGRQKQ